MIDLRGFIKELENNDKLKRVKAPVDKDWEISCIARNVMNLPPQRRYAILFENVKGFKNRVMINAFASRDMYALGLESTVEGIDERWYSALSYPLSPELVDQASCKENVLTGDEVDLDLLPHAVYTPQKDEAPYIASGCVLIKDPETAVQNVGIYRCMVKGKNKLGLHIEPPHDGGIIYFKHRQMDKPMEIAIVIGVPPVVHMSAAAKIPFGVDELTIAGGLAKSPLKVAKCETVDLQVPADAEIVIEGIVSPKRVEPEGPFGEFYGYMGERGTDPEIDVTAITFRNEPIYQLLLQQKAPNEGNVLRDVSMEAFLKGKLKGAGVPGVTDVCIRETSAIEHLVVGIKKLYPGHVLTVAQACWIAYPLAFKQIIVVDDDCDILDPGDVEWRVATCVQPDRDVQVVSDAAANPLDPSIPLEKKGHGSKMLIDATRKFKYPDMALPPKEMLDKARKQWRGYSLPKLAKKS
ncbi:MAG: UbiD family decarboxylase [Methanobacteriota archaeon]